MFAKLEKGRQQRTYKALSDILLQLIDKSGSCSLEGQTERVLDKEKQKLKHTQGEIKKRKSQIG